MASTANGLMRKVFFAGPDIEEGNEGEEEKKETTHEPTRSELKEAAADQAPTAVALSQQAKQLMALKKVEWDLIVVSRPRFPSPKSKQWAHFCTRCSSSSPLQHWQPCLAAFSSGLRLPRAPSTRSGTRESSALALV